MMRVMLKRSLSVLLVFSMTLSVCMVSAADVQAEELAEETVESEAETANLDEAGQDKAEQTGIAETETGDSEQSTPEEQDGLDQIPMLIDEPGEDEDEDEDDQEPTEPVTAEYSLALEYDDHESLSDIMEDASIKEDLTEYPYVNTETTKVISHKVSKGDVTTEEDEVAQFDKETGTLIATGIGTATVTFSKTEINKDETAEEVDKQEGDETNGEEDEETGDSVVLDVEVSPATLTVMFIAGQSNAEGTTSSGTGEQYSVACKEGTVYSTYAPASSSSASKITGNSGLGDCTVSNASSFVAGSLTGTTDLNGNDLVYPLNSLTEAGSGKTGMDSGLAYQWHKDTGDKVWVINAGYSATNIIKWVPGESCYERAEVVYKDAMQTADAEINAGHYAYGNRLLFWLQGEDDSSMTVSTYKDNFRSMYQGFENAGLGIETFGIIMVRANTGSQTTSADVAMTSPRTAQYLLNNSSSDPDVYVVSNVNEQWVTDSKVASYFKDVYGSSLTYPQHSSSGLPTTVSDVHADVHYSQVGHNENGITAAKNMYQIISGASSSPDAVNWYDPDGNVLSSGSIVYLETDDENTYIPVANPVYLSKGISVTSDSSNLTYDENTGTISGSGVLTAEIGGVSSSLTVSSDELATPVLNNATCSNGEITVIWNEVSDATGYRVFRKPSGGSWSGIATTNETSYVDADKLESGTTYYYTVRAFRGEQSQALANTFSSSYWSSYDSAGVSATAVSSLSTPTLSKATASDGSIKVTWNSVNGASGYRVYRKTSGSSWAGIAYTTDTSYTDSQVEDKTTYYYTVRAYKGEQAEASANQFYTNYWSDFDSKGVSATASTSLVTPHLTKASVSNGSVLVTWNAVSGAGGYRVFRKTSGGSWSGIATTTSTSYTDNGNLDVGTTYYYTVRAFSGDYATASKNTYMASYWSSFESGLSVKVTSSLATPVLVSAKTSGGSNIVTWNSVNGAGGYRVYRKTSGGSWSGVATTTSTSYTDENKLEVGTTYYYTVRAYKGDSTTALANQFYSNYWSDYDSSGVSVKAASALSTPTLSSATTSGGSNIVTWKSVSGAGGYRVYRKTSGGSWAGIATTASTSFTDDSKLEIGTTYYYTVRAFKGDSTTASANQFYSNYWSDYDSSGVSVKAASALSTPTLSSAKSSGGSNTITWKSVNGAGGYRLFRKPSGGSWSGIATTSSTSYTDTSNLDVGTTYYYTVRAFKGDSSTASANQYDTHYWSDFESGLSVKQTSQLSTPALIKASASTAKITVTWSAVSNASGYRVYRKKSGGSWAGIGNTTSTSYTDSTNLDAGVTYYYTVRAYQGDYSTASANTYKSHYWSDYESSGVSATAISVLSTPTLKSVSKGSSGVTVTFGSVSGAGGYRVYRKASGGSWSGIGNTTSTSYTDTSSLSSGKVYYYTVRAYVGDYSTASSHMYDVNYWSYYDTSGIKYTEVADTDMYNKAQSYSSSTKYLIMINTNKNKLGVFTGSKGNWEMKYYWSCSTGKASTPTGIGTFKIGYKGKSFGSSHTCWYYSQFNGSQLIHSVLYKKGSMTVFEDGRLGMNISHGCVRLALENAKWVYDNVPKGSTVVGFK